VLVLDRDGTQLTFESAEDVFGKHDILRRAGVNPPALKGLAKDVGLSETPASIDRLCQTLSTKKADSENNFALHVGWKGKSSESVGNEPVIEADSVEYSYGSEEVSAIKNLKLRVNQRELVGLIGANGSGKTTLLKLLSGLLRPDNGSITICGSDVVSTSVAELSREVGFLMQNASHQLVYADTLAEEIAYGLSIDDDEQREERISEALETVELEGKKDNYPGKLSFGEKKKLALACVLARDPEVILLDEPFFGLDYGAKSNLSGMLKSLVEEDKTVVVATHDIEAMSSCATQVALMHEGKVDTRGSPADVLTTNNIEDYGVEASLAVQLGKCLQEKGIGVTLSTYGDNSYR
jgi:energy-coupling factor transporter ATP-binding protein EcfA2